MQDSKRCSIVDSLEDGLEGSLGGPDPDYLKWLDSLLFAEIGNASDHACYKGDRPEVREAWRICGDAVSATHDLLELERKNPSLFQKVACHFSVLPCLASRHPNAARFNQRLFENAQLGEASLLCEQGIHGKHYAHQSWPVRYAYALIFTIDLTLDRFGGRLSSYAKTYGYGVRHPIDPDELEEVFARSQRSVSQKAAMRHAWKGAYRVLPKWTRGLEEVSRPLSLNSVLSYWRKGKKMILEEIPQFHLRPEWETYRKRHYQHGAKKGAIQHAIFKDILAALRTIAGTNKEMKNGRARKGARRVK